MCSKCRYMASSGKPGGGAEVEGVNDVREKNFTRIIEILKQKFSRCTTALDVGCSHGVFLKIAEDAGFSVTGIEPDAVLAEECRRAGHRVITGFFPDAEALSDKTFDAIIFNDSFEHIPNLAASITGIQRHLNKGGVAILNLPTSDGLMAQTAFLLNAIGMHTAWDRLWQNGFASPHLHFFNQRNLELLFKKQGFDLRHTTALPFYTIKGLWKRISCKSSLLVSLVTWPVLTALYPLFSAKSDCFAAFFSMRADPEGAIV